MKLAKPTRRLLKLSPKNFILNHLVPFILRDAGNGFAMETWITMADTDDAFCGLDGIEDRRAPACKSVSCVGGSIQVLTGLNCGGVEPRKAAKLLGITAEQAHGLFYDWEPGEGGWPSKHAERFYAADTPLKKARVTCSLLKQIAKKGSKALPQYDGDE